MSEDTKQVQVLIEASGAPQAVKAKAWDAYYGSPDKEKFKSSFDGLDMPKEVKAELWRMKFPPAPRTATPPTPKQTNTVMVNPVVASTPPKAEDSVSNMNAPIIERMIGKGGVKTLGSVVGKGTEMLGKTLSAPSRVADWATGADKDPKVQENRKHENDFNRGFGIGLSDTGVEISSPVNLALALGSMAVPAKLASKVPKLIGAVKAIAGGVFTAEMAKGLSKEIPEAYEAYQRGDFEGLGKAVAKSMADLVFLKASAKLGKSGYKQMKGGAPAASATKEATPAAVPASSPAPTEVPPTAEAPKSSLAEPFWKKNDGPNPPPNTEVGADLRAKAKAAVAARKPVPKTSPSAPVEQPPAPRRFPVPNKETGRELSAAAKAALDAKIRKDAGIKEETEATIRERLARNTEHLAPRQPKPAAESAEVLRPIAEREAATTEYERLMQEAESRAKSAAERAAMKNRPNFSAGRRATVPPTPEPPTSSASTSPTVGPEVLPPAAPTKPTTEVEVTTAAAGETTVDTSTYESTLEAYKKALGKSWESLGKTDQAAIEKMARDTYNAAQRPTEEPPSAGVVEPAVTPAKKAAAVPKEPSDAMQAVLKAAGTNKAGMETKANVAKLQAMDPSDPAAPKLLFKIKEALRLRGLENVLIDKAFSNYEKTLKGVKNAPTEKPAAKPLQPPIKKKAEAPKVEEPGAGPLAEIEPHKMEWLGERITEVQNNAGQAGEQGIEVNIYAAGKEKPVVNANYYPDTDGPFLKWIGKLKTITGDVDHIVARANNEKFSVDSKYDPYRQYGKFPGKARPTSNPPTAGDAQ